MRKVFTLIIGFMICACHQDKYQKIVCINEEPMHCFTSELKVIHDSIDMYLGLPLTSEEIRNQPNYFHSIFAGASLYQEDENFEYSITAYHLIPNSIITIFYSLEKSGGTTSRRRILDFRIIYGDIENLNLSFQTCEKHNVQNSKLIALVNYSVDERMKPAVLAWEADVASKKLNPVDHEQIICATDTY